MVSGDDGRWLVIVCMESHDPLFKTQAKLMLNRSTLHHSKFLIMLVLTGVVCCLYMLLQFIKIMDNAVLVK